MPEGPQSPHAAIAALIERLAPVAIEEVDAASAIGRVLGESLRADRPSPPSSVSAMDGYAMCARDAKRGELPVLGEARIGRAPPVHRAHSATRISTGAPIPEGCDSVVKREDTFEHADRIVLRAGVSIEPGQHVRARGENVSGGAVVLGAGSLITPAASAALAMFGAARARVHRKVRVAAVVTGDELRDVAEPVDDFTIRDSNGPTILATIRALPWGEVSVQERAPDDEAALRRALGDALSQCDVLVVSGGVSMGGLDMVPAVLESLACQVVFHRLPQRPGRPMLGAIGPDGQAILALPGNPVSVLCVLHRIGLPVMRHCAGLTRIDTPTLVSLLDAIVKPLDLWWYRPVRLEGVGVARVLESMGSGDVPAIAGSDGFVEIPPGVTGSGPFAYRPWSV